MSTTETTTAETVVEITPEECTARAGFYRLIAGAFVEEPTRAYLEALRSEASLGALAELGVAFDADVRDTPIERLEHDLACEYTAMFASSGGFPPVESVRRQGGFQQQAHTEICEVYRRNGFTVVPARFHVFEDNLGTELQFAAALLDRMGAALTAGDGAAARAAEKELKRFWALHLGLWVRGYASLVAKASEHSFYREMARLLRAFAESELETLGVNVLDEDGGRYKAPKPEMPAGGTCGSAWS